MPAITKRKSIEQERRVKFNFDITMLNALIRYTQCEYISKPDLYNLEKLINYTNPELYRSEFPVYTRLMTLQSILNSMIELRLNSLELIRNQLSVEFSEGLSILDDLQIGKNQLSTSECEYLAKFIYEKLQYIEIYKTKDQLIQALNDFDRTVDYNTSYYDTIMTIKDLVGRLMMSLQENTANQGLVRDFAFSDEEASNTLLNIVKKAQMPASILQTGIRQLNAILSPGFQSGRLYTILGGSGKFKSGTLLNLADQIRLFNPQINPYENGMRKCIFFITLENTIEETVERLFDMYSPMDADIRNLTPEEVIETLKTEGNFNFSGGSGGIDIAFHYAGNLEISTADIYGLVTNLNNKGYQPICIVLDYIKRINSAHNSNGDERVRMSFVAKELKNIAQFYQIPVITAMQLNREGNSIIDAAMRDSKQDVARFVGSSSIGNAWDIIEDSDWVCLINLEMQKSSQQLFLTFKRLKIRGKKIKNASDYFNHPFINAKNIRLEPDVNKEGPISVISLANDLESINESEDDNHSKPINFEATTREKRSSASIISSLKGASSPSSLIA